MFYFALGFIQVALVSIQSRNYTQGRYGASFLFSMMIAATWWTMVHFIATDTVTIWDGVGYVMGNSLGGVFGIWLHKRFASKKDADEW